MAILNRDSILKADDLVKELVSVPAWGGDVMIRTLTAEERDQFEASMQTKEGVVIDNFRARLVALCAVDEEGNRLFPNKDDYKLLGQRNAGGVDQCFQVACRLNGIGAEAEKTIKNSDTTIAAEALSDSQ